MNFLRERSLSRSASDLIDFDADSIRQVVSAQRLFPPDVWLVDPDAYETNGRVLRDSESARMLAYSMKDHMLYATDGCNSCMRRLSGDLESMSVAELKDFAKHNEIGQELLERLRSLLQARI
jgi:hypothetical protein